MAMTEPDLFAEDLHPIDIVETLAAHRDWDFDRVAENQIAMAVEGTWRTYSLSLAWSHHDETLRLICSFEMDPPADRLDEIGRLMHLANDLLWTGGFNFWPDQALLAFRYGLILSGDAVPTEGQIEAMLRGAITATERFYPAFQLVATGDDSAEAALSVALAEAVGRA